MGKVFLFWRACWAMFGAAGVYAGGFGAYLFFAGTKDLFNDSPYASWGIGGGLAMMLCGLAVVGWSYLLHRLINNRPRLAAAATFVPSILFLLYVGLNSAGALSFSPWTIAILGVPLGSTISSLRILVEPPPLTYRLGW